MAAARGQGGGGSRARQAAAPARSGRGLRLAAARGSCMCCCVPSQQLLYSTSHSPCAAARERARRNTRRAHAASRHMRPCAPLRLRAHLQRLVLALPRALLVDVRQVAVCWLLRHLRMQHLARGRARQSQGGAGRRVPRLARCGVACNCCCCCCRQQPPAAATTNAAATPARRRRCCTRGAPAAAPPCRAAG